MDLKEKNIAFFKDNASGFPELKNLDRSLAMSNYQSIGFPHPKMEKWQKSKIKQVLKQDFDLHYEPGPETISGTINVDKKDLKQVEFVNGNINGVAGIVESSEGVLFGSIEEAIKLYPAIVEKHLNKYVKEELNGLNALNNATFTQGLFLYVPKNTQVNWPFQWLISNLGENSLFIQYRNLIVIEDGASIDILHNDQSDGNGSTFCNSVTEIFVGKNARLNWYRQQDLRKDDSLVNSVFSHLERDAYIKILNTSLHGSMIRNDVHVKMDGPGCDANVLGLYIPLTGEQVDNQVFMEHAKPHCVSNELFKGVLDGKGSSIFNGHILVAEDAQKTNAYQTNRSILLSDEANAFAKPFLEIYADDVKCSHGATVGQLDKNALFYLRSRGLSEKKARSFLIKAFVGEVLDHCDHEGFRMQLEREVNQKLENH